MHGICRHLLNERLERSAIYTHGYWRHGAASCPDHDFGDNA